MLCIRCFTLLSFPANLDFIHFFDFALMFFRRLIIADSNQQYFLRVLPCLFQIIFFPDLRDRMFTGIVYFKFQNNGWLFALFRKKQVITVPFAALRLTLHDKVPACIQIAQCDDA